MDVQNLITRICDGPIDMLTHGASENIISLYNNECMIIFKIFYYQIIVMSMLMNISMYNLLMMINIL